MSKRDGRYFAKLFLCLRVWPGRWPAIYRELNAHLRDARSAAADSQAEASRLMGDSSSTVSTYRAAEDSGRNGGALGSQKGLS
jgi:hypothetical protein